ncbi:MAG: prolipoprotein diacylglyceryl transferase [Micromonosporaceae bacterium]
MNLASIPSPGASEWRIPLPFVDWEIPIRAYALCIVAGIIVAVWLTERRLQRRGVPAGTVIDVAMWAVPFGIIGARIYHVITDYQLYFAAGKDPMGALRIYEGGLGIPGALLAGALGAWIACRQRGVPLSMLADALAPALPVAQAIGRLGNWFNQELYGKPTTVPWALEIDADHRRTLPEQYQAFETFHPTFLYEALWNLGGAGLIWWLDKRFGFGRGRAFALYVVMYSVGRFWVESLRIDTAHSFAGMRLNMWTALLGLIGGLAYFLLVRGPQQRLVYAEDGTPSVVDADRAVDDAADGAVDDNADAAADADSPSLEKSKEPEPDGETSARHSGSQ